MKERKESIKFVKTFIRKESPSTKLLGLCTSKTN